MTQQQFNNQGWKANMICIYKGKEYPILAVDFEEQLVAIFETSNNSEESSVNWKRCENVELK